MLGSQDIGCKFHTSYVSCTFGDSKDQKASSTPKQQKTSFSYFPPQTLIQSKTAQVCRNFNKPKDELCEVDIQAKTTNIQAQSHIEQTVGKPGVKFGERENVNNSVTR